MKKILLVCSAGMSTSILVDKMKKSAEERGINAEIEAKANAGLDSERGNWDVVLVGPQIRYAKDQVEEAIGSPTAVIDMRHYGLGDGAAVLDQALELAEEE